MDWDATTPEEPPEEQQAEHGRPRRKITSVALLAAGLVGGAVLAGSLVAGAQTPTPSVTPKAARHAAETALTGTTADKVKAAALAAVPGGTIIRVETDSDGSPYEAHVRKADGSEVVVKVDDNFKVTDIEACHARGDRDAHANESA